MGDGDDRNTNIVDYWSKIPNYSNKVVAIELVRSRSRKKFGWVRSKAAQKAVKNVPGESNRPEREFEWYYSRNIDLYDDIYLDLQHHVHVVCNRVNLEVVRRIPRIGIHYATLPVGDGTRPSLIMYICSLVTHIEWDARCERPHRTSSLSPASIGEMDILWIGIVWYEYTNIPPVRWK